MNWATYHKRSEIAASAAHEALRAGRLGEARPLFVQAAEAEESALAGLDVLVKPKTFGITSVSAASLWFKAEEFERAEVLAHRCLAIRGIPVFAADQLREILQAIWNEQVQRAADVQFVPGQITVSVDGGQIVRGGAPLDLVVEKVQTIQSMFYRTAEFLQKLPLRRSGLPSKLIQDFCRPWLFQSVPGSYQFSVAIEEPRQQDIFQGDLPSSRIVASTFMSILENIASEPQKPLETIVSDTEYRNTFLKLTRNLAPTGKSFSTMEISSPQSKNPVLLTADSRKAINQVIRPDKLDKHEPNHAHHASPEQIRGILRALDLERDWLEILVDGKLIQVSGVGESVDDVIGPMVNHNVIVHATADKQGRYRFNDIEPEE